MKPFLEEVTEYILQQHAGDTGNICLVAPNRRAGLFFRRYFSSKVSKTMWAPETLSIEDFINRLSGLSVADGTSLLFHFYEVYLATEKENAQPLDEFLRWAPVLLSDIDEVDANLTDPSKLYGSLTDIKRIETWNPDGSPLTEFQKQYLAFFEKIETWHNRLVSSLLEKKLAYQGMSSRLAVELLKNGSTIPWGKVFFIGFNALTRSEEAIISMLLQRQQAEYLPDADPYYVNDEMHEAGLFIRKYARRFSMKDIASSSYFSGNDKNINILGIAKNVNQARLAGNILMQVKELTHNVNTAIVLANEKLLIPVLNALPTEAESINVTMGYPLNKTSMYGFFEALWKLWLYVDKSAPDNQKKPGRYYHKDIIRLFSHPCSGLIWDIEEGQLLCSRLIRKIKMSNRPFFTFSELIAIADPTTSFEEGFSILKKDSAGDEQSLFDHLLIMISRLDQVFRQKASTQGKDIVNTPYFIDFEALYLFSTMFRRMQGFIKRFAFIANARMLYTLFRQLASETRLSFTGEPLEGLQVMGMLETRNLDFKNVILLSANENILPRPKSNNTFIPYDIKKSFGLLVHTDKDAIYAYHFYRLLQRAENIYLIYNTQAEDLGSNEKSRYLTQLQMELPHYAPGIRISEHIVALPPPNIQPDKGFSIARTNKIMQQLQSSCESGFSPSALSTFINCQLQFYLRRIAMIEEPEDVEETIEATTMGTVVHAVLEAMYRPFIGRVITSGDIAGMRLLTEGLAKAQFSKHYPGGDITSGKNLLLFNLAKRYVNNFLASEENFLRDEGAPPVRILALEQKMEGHLELSVNGKKIRCKVRGMADRIDLAGSTVRVIDYKTGKVKRNELKFSQWDVICNDSRYGKAFQLMMYAWLYKAMNPDVAMVQPGIMSLRETKKGIQTLITPDREGSLIAHDIDTFGAELTAILQSLLDESMPFTRTEDHSHCLYCPFKIFCRRY